MQAAQAVGHMREQAAQAVAAAAGLAVRLTLTGSLEVLTAVVAAGRQAAGLMQLEPVKQGDRALLLFVISAHKKEAAVLLHLRAAILTTRLRHLGLTQHEPFC